MSQSGLTQDALAGLAERILSAKRQNPGADTTALEREIDRLVYALYLPAPRLRQAGGLTPAETCPPIGRRVKLVVESSRKG